MQLTLPLAQSWLPEPEAGFLPGTAALSWANGMLYLEVDLVDEEVISTATAHGQRLWEHGDVVELFIQKEGESGYSEYQLAPNGFTLSLRYPDITCVAVVRSGERAMEEFLTEEIPSAEVSKTDHGWRVSLSIHLPSTPGERFRVSCCRYDAGSGRAPVISSTSSHPVRDFHRPQDWREFIPVAG
jgi:hypothetical protein